MDCPGALKPDGGHHDPERRLILAYRVAENWKECNAETRIVFLILFLNARCDRIEVLLGLRDGHAWLESSNDQVGVERPILRYLRSDCQRRVQFGSLRIIEPGRHHANDRA